MRSHSYPAGVVATHPSTSSQRLTHIQPRLFVCIGHSPPIFGFDEKLSIRMRPLHDVHAAF
jgi:hypothetical protein